MQTVEELVDGVFGPLQPVGFEIFGQHRVRDVYGQHHLDALRLLLAEFRPELRACRRQYEQRDRRAEEEMCIRDSCHGDYQPAATSKPFDTGKWYHVAAVWSGKSWDIFIDGVYVTGVATQGETINLSSDNSGGFYLGASYGGGRPLNGYVAECRVWRCV